MNYSRKIWNILTRHMKTIDKRLLVLAIEYPAPMIESLIF